MPLVQLTVKLYFLVHVLQTIVNWGDKDKAFIIRATPSKPTAPSCSTSDTAETSQTTPMKRKKKPEASEDKLLMKKLRTGEEDLQRNQRQEEELKLLQEGTGANYLRTY